MPAVMTKAQMIAHVDRSIGDREYDPEAIRRSIRFLDSLRVLANTEGCAALEDRIIDLEKFLFSQSAEFFASFEDYRISLDTVDADLRRANAHRHDIPPN